MSFIAEVDRTVSRDIKSVQWKLFQVYPLSFFKRYESYPV